MALREKIVNDKGEIIGDIIRPPFIGFIKNNWLRRISMIAVTPIMVVLVLSVNAIRAVVWWCKWAINYLKTIPGSYVALWSRPRKKGESIKLGRENLK